MVDAYRIDRDVIAASGPDAAQYLQGQLSQDISTMGAGDAAWSFLLEPTGKTVAWLRVTRTADDAFVLDTDPGVGQAVVARLERFKLRTKCDFTQLDWEVVVLRGDVPSVAELVDVCGGASDRPAGSDEASSEGGAIAVIANWPVGGGVDVLGPAGAIAIPLGATEGTAEDYAALRIAAGVPVTGVDLVIGGIPNEAGRWFVDHSVSFNKGCYTGQELVARIDSRGGNVPRPLRHVAFDPATEPSPRPGADVLDAGGKSVGHLTSVAPAAGIALASVGRAVDPPAAVTVAWDGYTSAVTVQVLPGA